MDLESHIQQNTEECQVLIRKLYKCHKDHPFLVFFNKCDPEYRELNRCMTKQRDAHIRLNPSYRKGEKLERLSDYEQKLKESKKDIAKFSETEFDPKDWINHTFKSPDANTNREQLANNLVMKLQLYIQEVNKNLEDTSQQIVQTMPRILRELESMQQEAVLLQNRMKSVQQDVQKVEHDTASAMESLLQIDSVKGRVQAVEMALREIDKWASLTADIDEVFASGDVEAMSVRLTQLQDSLKVLGPKLADYEERKDYLDSVKDQFISIISPSVVNAFTSQSAESVQYFSEMFCKLDRQSDLEQYYQKCLKVDLSKPWKEIIAAENDCTVLFSKFTDHLLSLWFGQLQWANSCLNDAGRKVCKGLSVALAQLDPGLISTLSDALDSCPEKLSALDTIKSATENFVQSISSSFQSCGLTGSLEASEFFVEIYRPLSHFLANYREFQQSSLVTSLNRYSFDQPIMSQAVNKINDSVTHVFNEAFNALEKCLSLTNGLAFPMLLKALHTYFGNYLTKVKKVLAPIKAQLKAENAEGEKTAFDKEDWEAVSTYIMLSKACGRMFIELDRLDEALLVGYNRMTDAASATGITQTNLGKEKEEKEGGGQYDTLATLLANDVRLRNAIEQLVLKIDSVADASPRFVQHTEKQMASFNNQVIKFTSEQLLGPVSKDIAAIPKLNSWSAATVGEALTQNLPTFSLSPQEYITKVGQYMMTFAHQLEPYLTRDDPELCMSLTKATLPYITQTHALENSEQAVQLWLHVVGEGIMARYCQAAMSIKHTSQSGAMQLAADIDYLCNVLEDIGLGPSETLSNLKTLMKMDYDQLLTDTTHPQHIVSTVREIRKKK